MVTPTAIIRKNPYFQSLTENDYENLLRHTSVVTLKPNEILFLEGDFSDSFYIVKEGAIRISTLNSQQETIFLARIGPEGFFGEQAFSPAVSPRRRATATAQVESILLKIPREFLLSLKWNNSLLENKGSMYIKEKLEKLAESMQETYFPVKNLLKNEKKYNKRAVIYYQGDQVNNFYLLADGEVELRYYDANRQLQQIISIGPGQLFGAEGLDKSNQYQSTAVAKIDSTIVSISNQYQQLIAINPTLSFKTKGKIIQFRSEYLNRPAVTSVIVLQDGNEIVCQQIVSENIFLATLSNTAVTNELKYEKNQYFFRELGLNENKIVKLLNVGIWEDSYQLLELITNQISITPQQLNEFNTSGHIPVKQEENLEIICKCMRVSRDMLKNLIFSKEMNFDQIRNLTGASTICGSCKPTILEMLGTDVWHPCRVVKVIEHNDVVRSFQLKPLQHTVNSFKPGQYLIIKAKINNVWVQRNYTLTSSADLNYYEITIKKEPKGLFSSWLFNQDVENIILYVAGPYGQFTLDTSELKPIVCFMGGIGITPAMAFCRSVLHDDNRFIYIDYSVASSNQFIFNNEFNKMTKIHKNIIINHRITEIQGRITADEITHIVNSKDNCHIYICGPKPFENFIVQVANQMHMDENRIHVEQFIHAGAPEQAPQMISLN